MGYFVLKHVTNTDLLSHHVKYRLTTLHKLVGGGGGSVKEISVDANQPSTSIS